MALVPGTPPRTPRAKSSQAGRSPARAIDRPRPEPSPAYLTAVETVVGQATATRLRACSTEMMRLRVGKTRFKRPRRCKVLPWCEYCSRIESEVDADEYRARFATFIKGVRSPTLRQLLDDLGTPSGSRARDARAVARQSKLELLRVDISLPLGLRMWIAQEPQILTDVHRGVQTGLAKAVRAGVKSKNDVRRAWSEMGALVVTNLLSASNLTTVAPVLTVLLLPVEVVGRKIRRVQLEHLESVDLNRVVTRSVVDSLARRRPPGGRPARWKAKLLGRLSPAHDTGSDLVSVVLHGTPEKRAVEISQSDLAQMLQTWPPLSEDGRPLFQGPKLEVAIRRVHDVRKNFAGIKLRTPLGVLSRRSFKLACNRVGLAILKPRPRAGVVRPPREARPLRRRHGARAFLGWDS